MKKNINVNCFVKIIIVILGGVNIDSLCILCYGEQSDQISIDF